MKVEGREGSTSVTTFETDLGDYSVEFRLGLHVSGVSRARADITLGRRLEAPEVEELVRELAHWLAMRPQVLAPEG